MRNEFRSFKIGRIASARILKTTFERKQTDDVEKLFDDWYKNLTSIDVDLEIDNSVKADVEEWLGVDKVYALPSGVIRASANLPKNNDLVAKILSFKNKVKVLSPYELKKEILDAVSDIQKLYK